MPRKALLVFGTLLFALGASVLQAQPIASVQLLRGQASLLRIIGGAWLGLGPQPAAVAVMDKVRTAAESRSEIKLNDGSVIRLKANTTVTVLSDSLQVQVGECYLNLRPRQKPFRVITPAVVAEILGTQFDVRVDSFGKTRIRVFSGLVAVKANGDARNRQLVLQAGMLTEVAQRGNLEGTPRKFDVSKGMREVNDDLQQFANPQIKLGPDRPALPPIRQSLDSSLKQVTPEGGKRPFQPKIIIEKDPAQLVPPPPPPVVFSPDDMADKSNSARNTMDFFDSMRSHRLREYLDGKRLSGIPGLPDETVSRPPDPHQVRSPHDQTSIVGPGRPGLFERPRIRQEVQQIEHRLALVDQELMIARAEAERYRVAISGAGNPTDETTLSVGARSLPDDTVQAVSPTSGLVRLPYPDAPDLPSLSGAGETLIARQARDRMEQARERVIRLREYQEKLRMQLNFLRNRLQQGEEK
jgi:hypothetical protein